MNEGLQFVVNNDIEYKDATQTELCIKDCPWCGDDRFKLYVNKEKGLYDCKKCGTNGNIYQLKAKYGHLDDITDNRAMSKKYKPLSLDAHVVYENNLWKNAEALEYLYNRHFTEDTIKHFRLGLEDDTWLLIPHIFEGQLWNYKKRSFKGDKQFKRVLGQPSVLFGADTLDYSKKALIVVEGEMDCMAVWQSGAKNVISVTGGAQTWEPAWSPVFNKFSQVFIVLDSDSAGQKGAKKLAEHIGLPKCKNVILPVKDANEYIKDESRQPLKDFIKEHGDKFRVDDVREMADYISSIDDYFDVDGELAGLELPEYPKLNGIINGFKAEDLIILLADSGVGKTTWTLNAMRQFLYNDHRCLAFCLEGKINYYILRMMSAHAKRPFEKLRDNLIDWELLKDEFAEMPMFFYSGSQATMNPAKMRELLPAAVKLFDIEFVVIDNLQKFVRGTDNIPQHTAEAVSCLKDLAVDLKIPILLISHITKRPTGTTQAISMHDAKSSSTIYQDADMVLIINVKQDKSYEFIIDKNRMGEGGLSIPVVLDKATARYYEADVMPQKVNTPSNTLKSGDFK